MVVLKRCEISFNRRYVEKDDLYVYEFTGIPIEDVMEYGLVMEYVLDAYEVDCRADMESVCSERYPVYAAVYDLCEFYARDVDSGYFSYILRLRDYFLR